MLRLRTLGGLSLEGSEGPLGTAGAHRRRLALFALLASSGERGVGREKLLAYLWPEADPDRSRHSLSEMLAALRRDLKIDALFHGTNEVRLDSGEVTSDLSEFEDALDRRELATAVAIYQGPFLDGFVLKDSPEFQRWAERERLRLEQRFRGALEALASDAKHSGAPLEAASWWSRLAEIDPLSAHVAIEVMSALAAGGDREGAIAYAVAHERRVREEFGAAPNQAVRAFAEKLKADPHYAPPPPSRASAPQRPSATRRITAPGDRDSLEDAAVASTTSRERGATIAGRYLLQRELGRGGMATVFQAHDLKHDRDVALKFIHAELADAVGTERFQSEIAVLAKLQHPHILPLYDSGEVEGALYYVMPYVGGESLRERLTRDKQLPVPEALRLAREVAGALAYAHEQGVIHRDIKPENILISNGHALVADFGIARAVSRAAGRRTTQDGFAVGTPAYMSPEQASGDPIDGRSDLYALACVVYEMLGGAPPFVGTSGRSVLAQRFTEDAPPIRSVREQVPLEVSTALARGLQRVPADRYQSVREFAAALDVMDTLGRPRVTRRNKLIQGIARWKWVILAALALLVAGALFAFRPPPLIPDLYVVLPFQHVQGAAPPLLNGSNCERLVYDAFGQWRDLKVVDDARTFGASWRRIDSTLTLEQAFAAARKLRAGRMVWGVVSQFRDSIQVRGTVYDVARERPLPGAQSTVVFDTSLANAQAKFVELADALLKPRGIAPSAGSGIGGTRSIAALRAYAAGHDALTRWDLARAEQQFRTAVEDDPEYAYASFWLAQAGAWRGDAQSAGWRDQAKRTLAMSARLSLRDSALAAALGELAAWRYPEACARYEALARRDSMDFAAWFGLSECRAGDSLVVRDASSPGGWRFRSSYGDAIASRIRALEASPGAFELYAGLAVRDLARFLYTSPNQLRTGVDSSGAPYAAYAARDGEALAFIPAPFAAIASGATPSPPSHAAAVDAQRALLLELASRWADRNRGSAEAYETLALALEMSGKLRGEGAPDRSALAAIVRARSLASDAEDARRLAITQTRLLVLAERFAEARALADSLLVEARDPNATDADALKPLAALTGRVWRTADLMRRAAPGFRVIDAQGRVLAPGLQVSEAARQLMGYVSLSAPAESVRATAARTRDAVRAYEPARDAANVSDAVMREPLTLAFPVDPALSVSRAPSAVDPWLAIQKAAMRHDTAAVRAGLAALAKLRGPLMPGELSTYWVYLDAWAQLAVGDSAAAARTLDASLGVFASLGPYLLDYVQDAGFLVRMMALRASLAAAAGDRATARRWAGAVVALWDGADPPLDPTVKAMRALAAAPGS